MILQNPTNNTISVQINGTQYSVEPNGKISLPNKDGLYWKSQLHGFMKVVSEDDEPNEDTPDPSEKEEEETTPADVLVPEMASANKTGEKVRQVKGSLRPKN